MTLCGRPTFAEIDMDALRHNLRSAREFIGNEVKIMAVVKANAYGHGAIECARVLESESVDWFGVALIEEAVELRGAGISKPILCLGGCSTGDERDLLEFNITPVIFNLEQAGALQMAASDAGQIMRVHIKIDTGMGRLGIRWNKLDAFIKQLAAFSNLKVEGLMSHYAAANDINENDFTRLQLDRFFESLSKFEAAGLRPEIIDIANSPGAVGHHDSRFGMIRLGGVLYGLGEDTLSDKLPKPELIPVMSLYSSIADIKEVREGETVGYGRTFTCNRDTRIALLPIGYNDGYRRLLSNKANVIINGRLAPVIGRISMDWTIVDVTEVPDAKIGSTVIMIGRENGLEVSAADLGTFADTISYEITCGIGSRIPRKYVDKKAD